MSEFKTQKNHPQGVAFLVGLSFGHKCPHDFRRLSAKLTGILTSAGSFSPNQLLVGSNPCRSLKHRKATRKGWLFCVLAPTVGFEPTTNRLTADCSTAELSRNVWRPVPELNRYRRICSPLHEPFCQPASSLHKYQTHSTDDVYTHFFIKVNTFFL